jgi:hypothetical protein
MAKLGTVLVCVAFAWLASAGPAPAQEKKVKWEGSCLCERVDEPGTFQLVIALTDANRADIRKRMDAGEGDTFNTVLLESFSIEEAKLCGRNKVFLGNKTIKIGYRRLDADLPYDASIFDKAKTLTIGGKP